MSRITPNQWTILESLKDGPRWKRSFQTVLPLLNDLIDRGLIDPCRPHLGRARNMVRLTTAGCTAIEVDPASVPAARAQPKPNSKAFKHVLGSIKDDASPTARRTCEAFLKAIGNGSTSREAVASIAAAADVQRPAIWKRLRDGGVIAPYASKRDGGRGRPLGGGDPGYSRRRRGKALASAERLRPCDTMPRVNRDPCPRCGTRGDIGCGHSAARLGTSF